MTFKIKDGVRIGTVNVFNSSGVLLVAAPSLITARNIALTGAVTGNVDFDGSQPVSITTTIAANSVALGTQTTGNYVTSVSASDGLGITGNTAAEGSLPALTNTDKGSSQNIFKNIANSTGTTQFSASTNTDSIRFAGGGSTTVTFDNATKTVTFTTAVPAEADTLATVTNRGATTATAISITNATASTTVGTGALIVTGGVGIGGALNTTGAIATAAGTLTTASLTASIFNTGATTLNIGGAATTISIGAATGTTTIANNLAVTGDLTISGTVTTINSTTLTVDDKNIELGSVATPTDTTADGGGITLRGATDKTFNWISSTASWTSSENINLVTGKDYKIAGTSVLTATTLGSAVVNSSLTSVGTITAGVWNGTAIAVLRGGTGQTSYVNGELLIGNTTGNTLTKATLTAGANITITNGAGAITIASTDTQYSVITEAEVTTIGHTTGRLITGQRLAYAFANITAANATTAAATTAAVTFNNSGTGDTSGTTFNGGTARTISTNTIGAVPTTRTLTGANGIDTLGDLSANRTVQLTGQALALHNLATNGIIARTGAGTVAARTITAGTEISVSNGDGVSGNPTIGVTSTLSDVTGRGATTTAAITITNATAATTTTTGALIVTGGIATAGNLHVGGEIRDNLVHSRSSSQAVSAVTPVVVDTFAVATYRAGRYILQITQGGNYQVSEFAVIHDGTTTYITEYSVLETNGPLGDFTADVSAGNVRIFVEMNAATAATVKVSRTLITV